MMRYSRAFALLLALSCVSSSDCFRLWRTGGHDVAAGVLPDIEGPSQVREEAVEEDERDLHDDGLILSSEEDQAGEAVQEHQGSISSVKDEEEDVGQEEPVEQDAEEFFSKDGEESEEEELEEQEAGEYSFTEESADDVEEGIDDEEHAEQTSFVQAAANATRCGRRNDWCGWGYSPCCSPLRCINMDGGRENVDVCLPASFDD